MNAEERARVHSHLDRIDELVKLARAAVRVSEVDSIKAAVNRAGDHLTRIYTIAMNATEEKGSDVTE